MAYSDFHVWEHRPEYEVPPHFIRAAVSPVAPVGTPAAVYAASAINSQ